MMIDAVATYARRTPQALACVDLETGQRWSYRELDEAVNRAANWLVARLGSASTRRVATIARNSAAMLVLNLACTRAGAVFVPCNWRLSNTEILAILDDAAPALVFCDEASQSAHCIAGSQLLSELFALSSAGAVKPPVGARRASAEMSILLYTSGTSGRQKGVMISEENVVWSQLAFNTGNGVCATSVFLCDMPLFHTAGLLVNSRSPLLAGGTVLISGGFDADKTIDRLSDPDLGVTHYFSVPQMAGMLWNHPRFDAEKLRRLEVYATGGASNPTAQIERFVNAGIKMLDGYGMTEAGSISGMPMDDVAKVIRKAGSVGVAYLSVETRVVDEHGVDVPPGTAGELWVRGPGVTVGYWNRPDETLSMFSDGWLMTGDMARIDEEGFIYIVDRKKDMFISGGENIYSTELEAVIAEMTGVAAVAIVGVPDEKWGEVGVAFVVAVPGKTLCESDIEAHCRSRMAAYKVPRKIYFRSSLPSTATGKVKKLLLKEELSSMQH